MNTRSKTEKTTKASEEPEIYRNGEGNPVIFANRTQAYAKAQKLGAGWSVHQSPESRRFYVRKLTAQGKPELPEHSTQCKGVAHYYDGALGYEAMKCDVCGYELDLNAEANAKATTERLAAQPQAQHSPLPWSENGLYVFASDNHTVCTTIVKNGGREYIQNAKLIVASVNHAEALAEALRRIAFDPIGASDATHQEVLQGIENIAREALANWEGAKS